MGRRRAGFCGRERPPLRLSNVDRAFRRIRERAEVRALPTYSLRHATAAILLAAGADVVVAAEMNGQPVAMFSETYADLLVESTRDVAAKAGRFLDAHEAAAAAGDTPPVAVARAVTTEVQTLGMSAGPPMSANVSATAKPPPVSSCGGSLYPLWLYAYYWWARRDSNHRPAD